MRGKIGVIAIAIKKQYKQKVINTFLTINSIASIHKSGLPVIIFNYLKLNGAMPPSRNNYD